MQKEHWKEIRHDYVDEDAFCYIDAWEDEIQQGKTIALVDMLSGRVIYYDPLARVDIMAQSVIKEISGEAQKEHPYSVGKLEDLLHNVVNQECKELGSGVNVEQNLKAMGFQKDEMIFFGFPPRLED